MWRRNFGKLKLVSEVMRSVFGLDDRHRAIEGDMDLPIERCWANEQRLLVEFFQLGLGRGDSIDFARSIALVSPWMTE